MVQTLSSRRQWRRELSVLLAQSATRATLSPAPCASCWPNRGRSGVMNGQQGTRLWLSQEEQQKIEKQCNADLEQTPITTQCHKDVGLPQPWRENSQDWLKGGMVLCKPINGLHPEGQAPLKKIQACTMAFKQMDQISYFQQTPRLLPDGGPLGRKSPACMPWTLMNLGGLAVAQNDGLFSEDPNWFPKKSKENPWNFSDNQLQEGKNVIGLQMGTNHGAPEAGMTSSGMPCQIL
ncbi:hypothetical protein QTO34_016830 [Cnephaeus nilssonii]|uniref:Uncharacterized protein n=1 Tax=Cnephaeus nilssonii TaxID=3371016 RepID=A0AA40LS75_CNENI|nr:hypothetical protein QTO34_016830 [Eptesicus nilssonii]